MCAFLLCRGGEAAGKGLFGGHPTPTSSIGWGQRAQVRWGPTRGRRRHSGDALCLSSPQKKKKAQGSNASSTWGLPRTTPAPSGDPLTPGKCNGEFLQPPPAPDSHQVSEARSKAEPSCKAIPPRPPPARGIAVAGGGTWRRWGGQRGWGPPAAPGYPPCPSRCCPPAWPQLARGLI